MKTAIIGTGALGSVVGVLLLEAGAEVVLIERDQAETEFIRKHGLRLDGVSGDRVIRPAIISDAKDAGHCDLVLTLVKSYDTESAVESVKHTLSPNGAVLTLQNGIGNYEILEQAFPGRVVQGSTIMGAMTVGRGHFRHTGFGDTVIGEMDGSVTERVQAIAELFRSAKMGGVSVTDNIRGSIWSKLIINAAINAPGTLLRLRNGDIPETEYGLKLMTDVVNESLQVVDKSAIKLVYENALDRVIAVCRGTAQNVNSMFQDILAGRKTEIDFINGALAREAESHGFQAPVNRTLANLIKALESTAEQRVGNPN